MKLRDIIAIVLLVAVALGGKLYRDGLEDPPSQRRPDPRSFEPPVASLPERPADNGITLPPESRRDSAIIVEVEAKRNNATGTAFSINGDGVWVTARHVTDSCDLVGLRKVDGRLVRVSRVSAQPDADISILWTRGGAPALAVIDPQLLVGQDGYSFGFPKGDPGDVYGRVIGRNRMLARGHYNTDEPIVAWTQLRRIPDIGTDLSGISGGPWVNAAGEVIGVHVAGAPRRGRSYSTAPRTLKAAIGRASIRPQADPADLPQTSSLTPSRFGAFGKALRQQQTVAQVVCLVGEKWRRSAQRG